MKVFRLFLSLCLLCFIAISSVAAAPTPQPSLAELTRTAQFAPADTLIYLTLRTDRAYYETLDRMLSPIMVRGGLISPDSGGILAFLNEQLAQAEQQFSNLPAGRTLDNLFFDWAGPTLSFIVPPPPSILEPVSSLTVIEVSQRAGAEAFVRQSMLDRFIAEREGYIEEALMDGILIYPNEDFFFENFSRFHYVSDSFILESPRRELIEGFLSPTRETRLAQTDGFNAVLNALPAQQYNVMGYLNLSPLLAQIYDLAVRNDALPPSVIERIDRDALFAALGAQGLGGTIFDERVFALDLVAAHGPGTVAGALGLPEFDLPETPSVDLSFARFVPADVAMYQQLSHVGTQSRVASENALRILPVLINQYIAPILEIQDPQAARDLRTLPLGVITGVVDGGLTELTTLTTEQLLDMIDGQMGVYASFLSPNPDNVEAVILFENIQPALTAQMLDGLESFFTRTEADFIREGDVILFDGPGMNLDVLTGLPTPTTNIFGVIDGLLVLTTDVLYRAPAPGESLLDTPAFRYATSFFPERLDLLWYINPDALGVIADPQGEIVLDSLESLALMATITESSTWVRATITLAP